MQKKTIIAANRFGLGAKPGDFARIDRNPTRWLMDQLAGPSRLPAEIQALPSTAEVLVEVQSLREMRRDARRESGESDELPAPDIVQAYGRTVRRHYMDQANARYRVAAATDQPFYERLVHFWTNHFAISADKQPMPAVAGLYEKEAIRPNVSGRFVDLLVAAESHPAMILYLDNQRSIGPNSTIAKRANRRRNGQQVGLNENLAREILELHTLGVDGGYSQADVTAFAAVITGWSVGGGERRRFAEGTPGEFEFRENIHEPGSQWVLGREYSQRGMDQGIAVLADLAMHPSTARFLATKLARHFIADEPDPSTIDRIAAAYLRSGGDLPATYEAMIGLDAAWQQYLAKYKTPQDFMLSTFRAFDHVPDNDRFVVGALDLMGQTPYRPGSPAGWPDTAAGWDGADALYKRIEWANTVGRFVGARVNPLSLADAVLGPALGLHTRQAIARAESEAQGTTLLLVSPEFQRR